VPRIERSADVSWEGDVARGDALLQGSVDAGGRFPGGQISGDDCAGGETGESAATELWHSRILFARGDWRSSKCRQEADTAERGGQADEEGSSEEGVGNGGFDAFELEGAEDE